MGRILIVDDEASIAWAFREFLADEGHRVELAASAEEALRVAERGGLDAVVLDVRLPGMDGLTALRPLRERIGAAPVVVMTAFGDLETAVRAIDGGAFDYLVKPFDLDRAATVVRRALESARPATRGGDEATPRAGSLIGSSPAMQEVFKKIALVASADIPVLITGESGTGKELVARAIHAHGARRGGPFLPICLPALSPGLVEAELFGHLRGAFTGASHERKGLLELAHGGTVLLDEVGDVPPAVQVKLLRAIEHREVTPVGDARPRPADFRVVAATNRPLAELIADGRFREDLFYRLNVFPIHLPPLRERREDIPALAEHFLGQAFPSPAGGARLSAEALAELGSRPWAGNVRELRNAVEHAAIVARAGSILPEHLPAPAPVASPTDSSPVGDLGERIAQWAREESRHPDPHRAEASLYDRFVELTEAPLLRTVMQLCGQNRAAAAQMLGIHRATLRQKLRRYGIES
jgi:DNA-binding NtrC family response regulator